MHPDFWSDFAAFGERGVPAEFWPDFVLFMEKAELRTPPRAAPQVFEEEGYTPPCIPIPTSKKQLVASKKLEKELKQAKVKVADKVPEVQDSSKKSSKASKSRSKPSKKQRKPHDDGPMMQAMKAFMQKKMDSGKSYRQAQKKWLKSSERASIVGTLSETERKRRRY